MLLLAPYTKGKFTQPSFVAALGHTRMTWRATNNVKVEDLAEATM